jgi:hypothetical protein
VIKDNLYDVMFIKKEMIIWKEKDNYQLYDVMFIYKIIIKNQLNSSKEKLMKFGLKKKIL